MSSNPATAVKEALQWVRGQLASLCANTENDQTLIHLMETDFEGKSGAYARGRVREAKTIYSAMAEVIRIKIEGGVTDDRR